MKEQEIERIFTRNKPRYNDLGQGESLKVLADKIMSLPGNARGEIIASNLKETKESKGQESLKRIEQRMKELGYPIKLQEIRSEEYYQESLNVLINLVKKEIFKMNDRDIFFSGMNGSKLSLFSKMMMSYFISFETIKKHGPRYWDKVFDFGSFEVTKIDKEKKEVVFKIEGYNKSSISCIFQAGYYYGTLKNVFGKEFFIEETKCIHAGDLFHEYKFNW